MPDPAHFRSRINYAADCIANYRTGRGFDTCFAMYDGEAVVTMLVRRAEKNPELKAGIAALFATSATIPWYDTAAKHAELSDAEIITLARTLREDGARRASEQCYIDTKAENTTEQNPASNKPARMRL